MTNHLLSPPIHPLPFSFDDTHHSLSREVKQPHTNFLDLLIFNSDVPFFEIYPEDIYTTPLFRQLLDSYLYFIETHFLP